MPYREVAYSSKKKTNVVATTQERLQLCMLAFAKSNQNRVIVKAHGLVISDVSCTYVKRLKKNSST